jgi:AcrR family transcriptional regulator
MPENVKPGRPAHAGRGQARTRLARRAVVTAARALFLERGYAATTVDAISNLSDVPPATVYRLFTSKLGILKALLDTSIGGGDQPLAVHDQPAVAALFTEPDPAKLLAGYAGITTAINQRSNDVYRVLVSAAGSDFAAAELLTEIQQQRDQGQGQIAHALARNGTLRAGLQQSDAADLIHALMSPEVYRLLVIDRQWTPEQYQQWLTSTLIQQLIPPAQPHKTPVRAQPSDGAHGGRQ